MRNLRDLCHLLGSTVVIALLQPAPEVFDLFDDVLLLAEGAQPVFCLGMSNEAQDKAGNGHVVKGILL